MAISELLEYITGGLIFNRGSLMREAPLYSSLPLSRSLLIHAMRSLMLLS